MSTEWESADDMQILHEMSTDWDFADFSNSIDFWHRWINNEETEIISTLHMGRQEDERDSGTHMRRTMVENNHLKHIPHINEVDPERLTVIPNERTSIYLSLDTDSTCNEEDFPPETNCSKKDLEECSELILQHLLHSTRVKSEGYSVIPNEEAPGYLSLDANSTSSKEDFSRVSIRSTKGLEECSEISTLSNHKQIQDEEKSYKCKQCPKMFSHYGDFKKHLRTHSGEKPYKCTQCSKTFSQRGNLERHLQTHSSEKQYKCTHCPKMFPKIENLRIHQLTHAGEKPYRCTRCPEMFSQIGNLRVHQRTHSGEKPYKCTKCSKTFSWKGNLKEHQRIHSDDKS